MDPVVLCVIAIVAVSIAGVIIKKAAYRGMDNIENKIRENKNRENGSQTQNLASLYGRDDKDIDCNDKNHNGE